MSDRLDQLGDDIARELARRDQARSRLGAGIARVKGDLEARPIGRRAVDLAAGEVRGALDETIAIARESKGIIAAMIAALALWALRNPIIAFVSRRRSAPAPVQED